MELEFLDVLLLDCFQNIFEPGAVEDESDVQRYKTEFSRIHTKMAEKSVTSDTVALTPPAPVTAVNSIDAAHA